MASNSFFVAFSHDDTFTNGIQLDLYMGFHVGFMVGVTLLWVWSYLSLFVLGKWDQWDCLTSLPIYGLQHYFGMHCTVYFSMFAFSRCHIQQRDSNFQVMSNSFWLFEWSPGFKFSQWGTTTKCLSFTCFCPTFDHFFMLSLAFCWTGLTYSKL